MFKKIKWYYDDYEKHYKEFKKQITLAPNK